jgi:hypothetical protein
MIDPELIDALKEGKRVTRLSEGAQIREALIEWFEKKGVKVKSERKRAVTRKRS